MFKDELQVVLCGENIPKGWIILQVLFREREPRACACGEIFSLEAWGSSQDASSVGEFLFTTLLKHADNCGRGFPTTCLASRAGMHIWRSHKSSRTGRVLRAQSAPRKKMRGETPQGCWSRGTSNTRWKNKAACRNAGVLSSQLLEQQTDVWGRSLKSE